MNARNLPARLALGAGALALVALAGGCASDRVPVDLEEGAFGDPRTVDLGDDPWRERRRMDLEQLDASLTRAAGGLSWMVNNQSGFVVFADTLGVPDFVNRSAEDLTVNLLFTKFLEDAARSTCRRLVFGNGDAEAAARAAVFRMVDVGSTEVPLETLRAQVAELLLRFHGRRVAVDDPSLGPWLGLRHRVQESEGGTAQRGWEVLCVALITHPDFYTY
ncbi:MAG: hypothetical protein ACFCGT_02530 [Sandaracinaceae bacterium]